MSIYQKRWSSTANSSTPRATNVLSSGVEPSTIGTSWNSVRWNKPSTSYRTSIASRFEKPYGLSSIGGATTTTTSPSTSSTRYRAISAAAKNAADVVSIGPSVSARASRFDTSNVANKEKYRNEARELINKWTSRERNTFSDNYRTTIAQQNRPSYRSSDSLTTSQTYPSAYRTSISLTPIRTGIGSSSSRSVISPSPTPYAPTPKCERPWRQRMAESSRIRNTHGDDVGDAYVLARSRSRNASTSSLRASSCADDDGDAFYPAPYRSRQSSIDYSNANSSRQYLPYTMATSLNRSRSPQYPRAAPTASTTIREESRERTPKKKSIKERTARRMSRQRSRQESSSSSENEEISRIMRSRSSSAQRRRQKRKKSTVEQTAPPPLPPTMQTSVYETGVEDGGKEIKLEVVADSDAFQSCTAASPLAPSISRSSSKNGVVKNQIIKSPSFVEVHGSPRSESKASIILTDNDINNNDTDAEKINSVDDVLNQITDRLHQLNESKQAPLGEEDDESQYNSIVHFNPQKTRRNAPAPVPGLWVSDKNEEMISKNKHFEKPDLKEETEFCWKCDNREEGVELKAQAKKVIKKVVKRKKSVCNEKKPVVKTEEVLVVNSEKTKESKNVADSKGKKSTTDAEENKKCEKQVNGGGEPVKDGKKLEEKTVKEPLKAAENKEIKKEVKKTDEKSVGPENTINSKVNSTKKAEAKPVTNESADNNLKKPSSNPIKKKEQTIQEKTPNVALEKKETNKIEPANTKTSTNQANTVKKEVENEKPATPPKTDVKTPNAVKKRDSLKKTQEIKAKSLENTLEKLEDSLKMLDSVATDEKTIESGEKKKKMTLDIRKTKKKKPVEQQTEKSFDLKSKQKTPILKAEHRKSIKRQAPEVKFRCKACKMSNVSTVEQFRRRGVAERATVLVDAPQVDVNFSQIRLSVAVLESAPSLTPTPVPEAAGSRCSSRFSVNSETRASVILDEMRGTEAAAEWTRDDEMEEPDLLILPDQSILEQYVKMRKRGGRGFHNRRQSRSYRPSSICSSRDYESSACASPCPSTVSELCLPSSVIIHEPEKKKQAERVPLTAVPKGFRKTTSVEPVVVRPVKFEEPKTLFERMIQEQAKRNRSSEQELVLPETRDQSPRRRGSTDDSHPPAVPSSSSSSSISQQFAAAAAAAAANSNSTGRYAAHLPVNRGDSVASGGRASVTSIDSQGSGAGGALDTAAKNIDQVIDLARHRHHQHRTKFKEAIDYLDQIFEDLKKECGDGPDVVARQASAEQKRDGLRRQKSVGDVQVEKKRAPHQQASLDSNKQKLRETNGKQINKQQNQQHPLLQKQRRVQEKSVKKQTSSSSPVEVVIPVRKVSKDENVEPTVAETIALPARRNEDKMDFTRRWLHDESLAHLPPANIAPNASYYQDFDERSLGSCSAEVAAFTNAQDKKSKASRKPSNETVRPRPFRPQPVYPSMDSQSNHSNTLPRVSSCDQLRRGSSADPYSTLRSMKSESGAPSPSAFRQVSPFTRGSSTRASLRSLPDRSPIRRVAPSRDPISSIDQLVAELDLNPDQASEKRRSFPTSNRQPMKQAYNEYERPTRMVRKQQQPRQTKSPLDDVASMLTNVVAQFDTNRTAFETINQERINPSRVEAMHNVFEKGTSWKMRPRQEEAYASVGMPQRQYTRHSPPPPQLPTTQPPTHPPPGSAASSNSSSGIGSQQILGQARRSLVMDQHSTSSRLPSDDEDDDDGFYDNIGVYDDRRFSRTSDLDASFHRPPPSSSSGPQSTTKRIGSFFRKIGGGGGSSNRPPGAAASLMSLNKIANETVIKPAGGGGLMKSSSMSSEPWKRQMLSSSMPNNQKTGIGARLKQSLFGSRKRLD